MIRKTLSQSLAALTLILGMAGFNAANACTQDGYLGAVTVFAGNFAIRGCALANGQLLSISSNTALFSILGTTYGGDGRTTFALPDTRGRSVVGAGAGPGLSSISIGEKDGAETLVLSQANMAAHSHTASASVEVTGLEARLNTYRPAWGETPARRNKEQYINAWTTTFSRNPPNETLSPMSIDIVAGENLSGTVTVDSNGGSTDVFIRDPYIGMYWLIQTQGTFPSRN